MDASLFTLLGEHVVHPTGKPATGFMFFSMSVLVFARAVRKSRRTRECDTQIERYEACLVSRSAPRSVEGVITTARAVAVVWFVESSRRFEGASRA
jgi:hypothetical protein